MKINKCLRLHDGDLNADGFVKDSRALATLNKAIRMGGGSWKRGAKVNKKFS